MSALEIVVTLCLALACTGEDSLEVTTTSGKVRGKLVDDIDGRSVEAFLGIPYGAPTGGQKRFSPPKEVSPWDGVLDATDFSNPCHQHIPQQIKFDLYTSPNDESEDCLKLNVWVPKPRPKANAVMVWIHGGGFSCGSSDVPLYNGAKLASQENVIVVSLNYRLSVYGFLYLAHPLAPGNMGLMDQTLGLQWVKKNINTFGGDPERITIFGESAGGASVGFHLISPVSLDLFRNAILQSGNINSPWAFSKPEDLLQRSLLLAKEAGCPIQEDRRGETVQCLQELSNEKLMDLVTTVGDPEHKLVFRPVIDENYIPASPVELLSKGQFCNGKNVLLGHTKHDGSLLLLIWASKVVQVEKASYDENDLKTIISLMDDPSKGIWGLPLDVVCHIYSEWNSARANFTLTFDGIIQASTDSWFGCPTTTTADKLAKNGNSVFSYFFGHVPEKNKPNPSWLGAFHASEIPFVFGHLTPDTTSQEDVRLSRQIMRYWTNFARTGDPNNEYLPYWSKYTNRERQYLELSGKAVRMENVDRIKECSFWENIFPKIGNNV